MIFLRNMDLVSGLFVGNKMLWGSGTGEFHYSRLVRLKDLCFICSPKELAQRIAGFIEVQLFIERNG